MEGAVAVGASILDRVFVPVDYSIGSQRALGTALELQRVHGSAICVFHAVEASPADSFIAGIGRPNPSCDWVSDARAQLRQFVRTIASNADVEVRARLGVVASTFRMEVHEWATTLIVASADVHSRLLRSPAEQLVRRIDVPVLVIPRHAGHAPGYRSHPGHRIKLRYEPRRVRVFHEGDVIADSTETLRLEETGYEPIHYFPRNDVVMDTLIRSNQHAYSPYKGTSVFFHVGDVENAAWSYEQPYVEMERIAERIAFYRDKLEITSG